MLSKLINGKWIKREEGGGIGKIFLRFWRLEMGTFGILEIGDNWDEILLR